MQLLNNLGPRFVLICVTSWWGIICKLQYKYNFWTIWAPHLFLFVWPPGEESYVNCNTHTTFEQSGPPHLFLFLWPPGEESYVNYNTNTTFEQSGGPSWSYLWDLLVRDHMQITIQIQLLNNLGPQFVLICVTSWWGIKCKLQYKYNFWTIWAPRFVLICVTSWWEILCKLQYKYNVWTICAPYLFLFVWPPGNESYLNYNTNTTFEQYGPQICSYLCDLLVRDHM